MKIIILAFTIISIRTHASVCEKFLSAEKSDFISNLKSAEIPVTLLSKKVSSGVRIVVLAELALERNFVGQNYSLPLKAALSGGGEFTSVGFLRKGGSVRRSLYQGAKNFVKLLDYRFSIAVRLLRLKQEEYSYKFGTLPLPLEAKITEKALTKFALKYMLSSVRRRQRILLQLWQDERSKNAVPLEFAFRRVETEAPAVIKEIKANQAGFDLAAGVYDRLQEDGVVNLESETSYLFTLSERAGELRDSEAVGRLPELLKDSENSDILILVDPTRTARFVESLKTRGYTELPQAQ